MEQLQVLINALQFGPLSPDMMQVIIEQVENADF
jgi:hypothetical protein